MNKWMSYTQPDSSFPYYLGKYNQMSITSFNELIIYCTLDIFKNSIGF